MRFCLSCRHASPGGSVYCGFCGRTFAVKLCNNKHSNPPQALCCTTCGSQDLTEPTRFLRFGWLSFLLAFLTALFVWKWTLAHAGCGLCLIARGLLWAAGVLFNTNACGVLGFLDRALVWLLLLWLTGHFLTLLPGKGGRAGKWLRGLPEEVFVAGLRLARMLALAGGRLARRVVFAPPKKSKVTLPKEWTK